MVGNEADNIFYYQNNGTPVSPSWQVVNGFWNNRCRFRCVPTFGDLDADGDLDMVTGNLLVRFNASFGNAKFGRKIMFSLVELKQTKMLPRL